MSFVKESQSINFDGIDIPLKRPSVELPDDTNDLRVSPEFESPIVLDEEEDDVVVEVMEPEVELVLTLDKIPGALDQEDIEEPSEIEVDEPEDVVVNDDPWDWGGDLKNYLPWLSKMMQNVPQHSGRDTVGIERVIAYFEALDRENSRAVRMDKNNIIDVRLLEKARDEIQRAIERCEERLEKIKSSKYKKNKKKKKADFEQEGFVKEAKSTHIGGISITVPLLISTLARICINSMVSAGHDIEDVFDKLVKKYKLTDREKLELVQLLADMGYPVRRDRGIGLDEETDISSSDNYDWQANFYS